MFVRALSSVRIVPLGIVVLAALIVCVSLPSVVEAQATQAKPPATVKPTQPPAKPASPPAAKPAVPETAKPADPAAKPDAPKADAPATPAAGKMTLESLAGTWDGVAQTPNGDLPVHAVLAFQDGKITGTMETQMGVLTITGATLTGDVFELGFDLQGAAGSLSGKVAGDKYEGSWTLGADSGPFAMARVPPTTIKK